jgi:CubicO group peptidase (beta-lactamase class C family)
MMKATALAAISAVIMIVGCHRVQNRDQPPPSDPTVAPAAKSVPTDAELVADVERFVNQLVLADQFSGGVLLMRDGTPLIRQAYGLADRATMRRNTADTPFALGSVSKMFTAVLVAQLLERNMLQPDTTIGQVLPDFPAGPAKDHVTVQQLLTMSSGIADIFQSPEFLDTVGRARTLSDFWPVFASKPLGFTPGSDWAYSNANFLVLGAIVEKAFGESFVTLAEQRIFHRAGMVNTSYQEPTSARPARGYTRFTQGPERSDGSPWSPAWNENAVTPLVHVPMGGGWSALDDLARFANALMQGRLVRRETVDRITTGIVPADYGGRDGYGFETRVVNGVRVAGHRGGAPGVANQVEFYPDLGYVTVVLGNTDGGGAWEIAKHVQSVIAGSSSLSRRRR